MLAMLLIVIQAFALGLLTSIAPCPLATNIAAVSYVGRNVEHARSVIVAGLLYTLGRTIAYMALATLILLGLSSTGELSRWLQIHFVPWVGPIMILIGMMLVGLVTVSMGRGAGVSEGLQKRVDAMGVWGALLLGVVFALAFCPNTIALFGVMIGIAVQAKFWAPLAYGIGTAVPVLIFAGMIAAGGQMLAKAYGVVTKVEWWARTLTGWGFIVFGVWLSLKQVFHVL